AGRAVDLLLSARAGATQRRITPGNRCFQRTPLNCSATRWQFVSLKCNTWRTLRPTWLCSELSNDFARYGDPARRLATGSKIVTDLCLGADQSPASTCRVTDEYVDLQVDAYSPRNDVSAKSEVRSQKEELRSD